MDPAKLTSYVMSHILEPSQFPDLHRVDPLTSQLSTEKFQLKAQLISLRTVSTPFNFRPNPNCYKD